MYLPVADALIILYLQSDRVGHGFVLCFDVVGVDVYLPTSTYLLQ